MDFDEIDPIKKKPVVKDLTRLSVGELKEYITQLQAEILRVESAIANKDKARQGAATFFKS